MSLQENNNMRMAIAAYERKIKNFGNDLTSASKTLSDSIEHLLEWLDAFNSEIRNEKYVDVMGMVYPLEGQIKILKNQARKVDTAFKKHRACTAALDAMKNPWTEKRNTGKGEER